MQDRQYPEILQELRDSIKDGLRQQGIDSDQATQVAHIVAENIRHNWGGMQIYICKGVAYTLNQRDLQIWNDFTGRNHHQLIKKYDITLQHLYRIIKIQRQNDLQDRQSDLFDR